MLSTPILLLIFNRPETSKLVFNEIRKQRPKYLFIAADGPRSDYPNDYALTEKCREIITQIDWVCEVRTLFREKNLGCRIALAEAINWFFEHVDQGIILEDDCLPSEGFFLFCEELLNYYKKDDSIMHITGTNLNDSLKFGDGTYYQSNYANVWGWATWRRAWAKFDLNLTQTDYLKVIQGTFKYTSEQKFWESRIDLIKSKQISTWDYQWMFSIWKEQGTCLNSNSNLVTNIVFGAGATHTTGKSLYTTPEIKSLTTITHPSSLKISNKADKAFIYSLHGIIRKGFFAYYLHILLIQRLLNLFHKITLLREKFNSTNINENVN